MKRLSLLGVLLLMVQGVAFSQTNVAVGEWVRNEQDKPVFRIRLDQHLTPKQRKLIRSGFSTYTETLGFYGEKGRSGQEFTRIKCTVKLDTWDEEYDIGRIDEGFVSKVSRKFSDYADMCLVADLSVGEATTALSKTAGLVTFWVRLNQISEKKAKQIRGWLIEQQSGVMKGLFSHMLGDLKLHEETVITARLPSHAEGIGSDQLNPVAKFSTSASRRRL